MESKLENQPSLWADIKSSIAGTEQDFTEGKLGRAILLLSIPMVLEMSMESVFAVVDIFFVSRLGAEAVATVGITESLITIVYAIGIGLAMGTTAMVSRRYGEKNKEGASIAAVQGIIVAALISLPIALIGIVYSKDLLRLMGAEPIIVDTLYEYTSIMIGGNIVIMLLFVINAVFRGTGDAAVSMRVLWLANGLNIILDPLLIFGIWIFPEFGIKGAAIATVTGRGIGVVYQFYLLGSGNHRLKIGIKQFVAHLQIMKRLIQVSLGGIFQFIIATTSWIGLVRILAEFGSVTVASYTIAIRIFIFSILPSWGMSNAAATLVGQNLGAGKPDRAEKSVWVTAGVNMIFLALVGIVFLIAAESLVGLFSTDPIIIEIGGRFLRIISYGYLAYAFGMIIIQAFNGAGDTFTPTAINFICFWLIEIPLAYFLALEFGFGGDGVFYAIVAAETLLAVIGYIVFKQGKWKTKQV